MDLPSNLRETTLAELIQIVEVSGRSGRLQIQTLESDEISSVYFNKGQIIHATTNRNQGIEAVWELFSWIKGRVIFSDGVTMPPQTIKHENIYLITEGLKKATKSHEIMINLPPMETRLVVNKAGLETQDKLSLDSTDWNFLILVDGSRTIKQLIDDSQMSASVTGQLIMKLLQQKVIIPA